MIQKKVRHYQSYCFPDPQHFAESLIVDGCIVYIPLNNTANIHGDAGVYQLNLSTKEFTPVFLFGVNEVVYVAKRTKRYFVCNVTTTNQLLIYDHKTQQRKYYPIIGCPNDLCIDPQDDNIAYVAANGEHTSKNGLVLRVQLVTGYTEIWMGNHETSKNKTELSSLSGINMVDDTLFVCTLIDVWSINKFEPRLCSVIVHPSQFYNGPMYDNISICGDKLHCAIYDYSDRMTYFVLNNHMLAELVYWLANCIGCVFYRNRTCNNRGMTKSKVHFMTYDYKTKSHEYVIIDEMFPEFDKEVTQVNQLNDGSYLLVNYKSNKLIHVQLEDPVNP